MFEFKALIHSIKIVLINWRRLDIISGLPHIYQGFTLMDFDKMVSPMVDRKLIIPSWIFILVEAYKLHVVVILSMSSFIST